MTNVTKPGHSKVTHFRQDITAQKNIITGEISMNDVIRVEKRKCLNDVMTDIDLDVVGDWPHGAFQKVAAIIHQLH